MPTFHHDQTNFFFRDKGEGLPFFFQHGLGADSSQTFDIFNPPAGIRLISLDTRDHGQTRPPGHAEKLSFNTFASDLLALMDHLKIDQAVIGGISMGAGITLNFTIQHPKRVLALVQSRPAWLDAPSDWNVHMFCLVTKLIREHGAKLGLEKFKETPEYLETLAKWPDAANSTALQFQSPQAEETAYKYERIIKDVPWPNRDDWANIQVPTLVLANHKDPVHPFDYGTVLAQIIPQAKLHEITPKSVSLEQHNADVQNQIESFLTRHFLT